MRKNGNLSEIKAIIFSQPFLKSRKFLLDTRKDFLKTNDFYLVQILSEPNNLIILTSKKILKMTNHCSVHSDPSRGSLIIRQILTTLPDLVIGVRSQGSH